MIDSVEGGIWIEHLWSLNQLDHKFYPCSNDNFFIYKSTFNLCIWSILCGYYVFQSIFFCSVWPRCWVAMDGTSRPLKASATDRMAFIQSSQLWPRSTAPSAASAALEWSCRWTGKRKSSLQAKDWQRKSLVCTMDVLGSEAPPNGLYKGISDVVINFSFIKADRLYSIFCEARDRAR